MKNKPVVIDANIILRYLLNDHPELSVKATSIIESNRLVIRTEVLCEVVYVLQKVYSVPRPAISKILADFMKLKQIVSSESEMLSVALKTYCKEKLDFVDCILIALHETSEADILSFDKQICQHIGSG